jgi:hypothetical protein
MAVTIDKTSADILANLILDDLRGYANRYPEAYAAYKKEQALKAAQQKITLPKKQRQSRNNTAGA